MQTLIECVPNISEGRRTAVIDRAVEAVSGAPGAALLNCSSDEDHNRTVLTLVGSRDGLKDAIRRLYSVCVADIDLRLHSGVHPRMGAVDVVPFVPIQGATMDDCVVLSREIGEAIATEFGVPVFLYAKSAVSEQRRLLRNVRKGGFEGLPAKMRRPEWTPDFGPTSPHPTAGASAIGARPFLIAYNIQLDTPDVRIAESIARAVRESSGGLPGVQAMGVFLAARNQAQVSMNVLDFTRTPLLRVFDEVRQQAARHGVGIAGSEIVGLIPQSALPAGAEHALKIENFRPDLVLEHAIHAHFGN